MTYRLTKEQRVAAIKYYYQNNNNGALAGRLLAEEFNIRVVQSRNIKNLIRKYEDTGSVYDAARSGRPVSATTSAKADELKKSMLQSPKQSSKSLSTELNISQSSAHRLLKRNNMNKPRAPPKPKGTPKSTPKPKGPKAKKAVPPAPAAAVELPPQNPAPRPIMYPPPEPPNKSSGTTSSTNLQADLLINDDPVYNWAGDRNTFFKQFY